MPGSPSGARCGEGVEEALHLFVEQRVTRDLGEVCIALRWGRHLAVEQQVGDLEEGRLGGKLLYGIAPVAKLAGDAVDERHRAGRSGGVGKPIVEGHEAHLVSQLGDVDATRSLDGIDQRKRDLAAVETQNCFPIAHDSLSQPLLCAAAMTFCASAGGASS